MTVLPFDAPLFETATDAPATRPAAHPAPELAYESPLVSVYHGRAEDVLHLLPTESAGLILTDPPYGVDWQSRRRVEQFDKIEGDLPTDRASIAAVMAECVRVVGQHRHLYSFGPADVFDGLKVSEVGQLVWDKQTLGSGDVTSTWGPSHELIHFTVSKHRHAGKTGARALPVRMRGGTVLGHTRPTGKAVRHPSEKPVPLLRELIESSSRQHELVIDPYAGVLSTAVAAILTGRRALVIESNRKYVDIGIDRITAAEALVSKMNGL